MSWLRRGHWRPIRIALVLTVLALTALAHPFTVRAVGIDLWKVGQAEQDFRIAQQDETRLNAERLDALEMAELNGAMFNDLIAGRADLSVVARQWWEMSQNRSGIPQYLDRHCAGPSMEAKMAHNLVVRVNEVCPEKARAAVDQRLRQQYEAAYGCSPPGE